MDDEQVADAVAVERDAVEDPGGATDTVASGRNGSGGKGSGARGSGDEESGGDVPPAAADLDAPIEFPGDADHDGPAIAPADVDLRDPQALDEAERTVQTRKFGTFGGVFTPTLLTILGVIMYLREGWVIGNAGILGGVGIILLAFSITTATALSMSSITTNIRIGAGGAYAIIAQSLGLEIGGALGIPRYVSQAFAVTLYVFGFREGWLVVFPDHPALLVDLGMFTMIVTIAAISAGFAIRTQYVIMVVIAASLVSIGWAAASGSMQYPIENVSLWGTYAGDPETGFRGTTFWAVFAVFFPASTGIMAGANMSGDLKDPRRSIPRGTLAAIAVSLAVYVLLAVWLARSARPEELLTNYTVMIDKAAWGPAVIAGLLGATSSASLSSLVGASRILMAMGDHRVMPWGGWLARRAGNGEPRNALLVTAVLIVATIMLRDLNAIAPLVTMFFLLTYAMLNGVLLIEQGLDLVSFRPALRVRWWIPLYGLVGSVVAMFIINPTLALVSLVIMLAFYVVLLRRRLDAPFSDVRSGLFVSVAEWASTKVAQLPGTQQRAWKPSILVPARDPREPQGVHGILTSLTAPNGTVRLMGIRTRPAPTDGQVATDTGTDGLPSTVREVGVDDPDKVREAFSGLVAGFRHRGVHATTTIVDVPGTTFTTGLVATMQALRGSFFRPNTVFLQLAPGAAGDGLTDEELATIVVEAQRQHVGTLLWLPHPITSLGQARRVNVWIRDRSPDWEIGWDIGNLDLSLLAAIKLQGNWDAAIRLCMAVADDGGRREAQAFLDDLVSVARVHGAETFVTTTPFPEAVQEAPQADVSIFGLAERPAAAQMRDVAYRTDSSCLFVRDSGTESALA